MFSSTKLHFKMALLQIKRRKRRAVLIALMISLSLVGLLFMEGMYDGMMVQITQNSIKTGSGTLSVEHKNFRSDNNIKYNIQNPDNITKLLDHKEEISSYVLRISQRGLIATAGYSKGVNVIGVDLTKEEEHADLKNFLTKGEYTFDKRSRGAIIGYRLARKLKVDVGKKVIITMQDNTNEVVSAAFKIRAIIKTNNMNIDEYGLLVDMKRLQALTGINGVTQISILLHKRNLDASVLHELRSEILDEQIVIYSYKELYPSLHESEMMMQTYNKISTIFIFVVASLGIFGVVMVSVLERVREFGIMMAIGTEFKEIVRLVMYESLLITMSGYIIGALLGGSLLWYFKEYGLNLSGFSDAFAIFGMDSNIYAVMKEEYFTNSFISVLLATLVATLIPLITLKRRNPIKSINEQT